MGKAQSKIRYFDGSEYIGDTDHKNQQSGRGRIMYANGNKLEGTFANGQCYQAKIYYKNGDYYEGGIDNNVYHGEGLLKNQEMTINGLFRQGKFCHGKVILKDGTEYIGSLTEMKKNGEGSLKKSDGSIYRGYFCNDKFEGYGVLTLPNRLKYEGYFRDNKYEGLGELINYKNGHEILKYKGDFFNGSFHGKGTLKYANQDFYEGQFREGLKHGYGQYKYRNGDAYSGKFQYDKKTDDNCTIHFEKSRSKYTGGIKDNKYHGSGCLEQEDGQYYRGGYLEGLRQGKGQLKTADYTYNGQFFQDYKHGSGTITFVNGERFEGTFSNKEKHGKGINYGLQQKIICFYDNGVKDGPYEIISNDGSYYEKGEYKQGLRNGKVLVKKGGQQDILTYQDGQII